MFPGNFPTLANPIIGAGNPQAVLHLDSSSRSDSSEDFEDIDDASMAFVKPSSITTFFAAKP